jgi:hypothetical protein
VRCGEQETKALVLTQPLGEVCEVPEFAEVHAELEEAVFMERQAAALVVGRDGFADGFDVQIFRRYDWLPRGLEHRLPSAHWARSL